MMGAIAAKHSGYHMMGRSVVYDLGPGPGRREGSLVQISVANDEIKPP
jgi:hypothetical protein